MGFSRFTSYLSLYPPLNHHTCPLSPFLPAFALPIFSCLYPFQICQLRYHVLCRCFFLLFFFFFFFFFYLPPSAEDTFLFRSSLILKCLDKKLGHIIGTDECILNEWMKNIQIDVPFFKPLTRWESIFLCMLRSLTWFVVTLKSTFILYSLLLKC